MASPLPLYSVAMHIGLRLFTLVFGGCGAVIAVQTLLVIDRQPIALAALAAVALFLGVFARIIWRTRPVLIDGDHLLIGRAARRRRIPFADVLGCAHPWWVYSDRFAAPLELTLRGGETVTFFPEVGAADLIDARRGGAGRG